METGRRFGRKRKVFVRAILTDSALKHDPVSVLVTIVYRPGSLSQHHCLVQNMTIMNGKGACSSW